MRTVYSVHFVCTLYDRKMVAALNQLDYDFAENLIYWDIPKKFNYYFLRNNNGFQFTQISI